MAVSPSPPPPATISPAVQASVSNDSIEDFGERVNARIRDRYVKGKQLGEGTYAVVYKGHLRQNPQQQVAIKKIKVIADYKEGLSMDAIREMKCLKELKHKNIIALHDVFTTKDQNVNLVLEFLPRGDLEMLIRDKNTIFYGTADIKAWMAMLCRGVWWCHEHFVLHRDIKPNNLLIAANGEIKLADFGLARSFGEPYQPMTYNVITRWYRPPELFFKARFYSSAVDIWSVGCVFAELILRTPFLPGSTDLNQVELISQAIGSPTDANWPGVTKLEAYVESSPQIPLRTKKDFTVTFPTIGSLGVDLLMGMLSLDPNRRPSAVQVLKHAWWQSAPRPTKNENLPKKQGGEAKLGQDLKRRGGELDEDTSRVDKVARRLDFSKLE